MNKKTTASIILSSLLSLSVNAETGSGSGEGQQQQSLPGAQVYAKKGNSLEIGGRLEGRASFIDGESFDRSRARLSFLGKVQIAENAFGIGFYEGEYTTADKGKQDSDSDNLLTRKLYAGVKTEYGELTYGKNAGALVSITNYTDIMSYHGASGAHKITVGKRADNHFVYRGKFDALNLEASYRFADRSPNSDKSAYIENDESGFSLSSKYMFEPANLSIGAGYAKQEDNEEYMLGTSAKLASLYLAGVHTSGDFDYDSFQFDNNPNFSGIQEYKGYELAAAYFLADSKSVITSTYNYATTGGDDSANFVALDFTYYFKPEFRTYISYNFNLLDEGDSLGSGNISKMQSQDEIAIGVRYDL